MLKEMTPLTQEVRVGPGLRVLLALLGLYLTKGLNGSIGVGRVILTSTFRWPAGRRVDVCPVGGPGPLSLHRSVLLQRGCDPCQRGVFFDMVSDVIVAMLNVPRTARRKQVQFVQHMSASGSHTASEWFAAGLACHGGWLKALSSGWGSCTCSTKQQQSLAHKVASQACWSAASQAGMVGSAWGISSQEVAWLQLN